MFVFLSARLMFNVSHLNAIQIDADGDYRLHFRAGSGASVVYVSSDTPEFTALESWMVRQLGCKGELPMSHLLIHL